jgi:hypothetical protein
MANPSVNTPNEDLIKSEYFEKQLLSGIFAKDEDRESFLSMLKMKKPNKKHHQVANLFIDYTLSGLDNRSVYTTLDIDSLNVALFSVGLNKKGYVYVEPEKATQKLSTILDYALDPKKNDVFSAELYRVLLERIAKPEEHKYSDRVESVIDKKLTQHNKEKIIKSALIGAFEHDFDNEFLRGIAENNGIDLSSLRIDEPRFSDDIKKTDYAELYDKAERESFRYQLDVDMQTEAQQKINELMERNKTWANRFVVDKLKDWAKDALKDSLGQHRIIYPTESIFSETLADCDVTGRPIRELVSFGTTLTKNFKATVKNPNMPDDAYEIMALRLKKEGVRHPFIKASFKSPESTKVFMEKTVKALLDAGYKLDDIKVQKELEPFFEYIKNNLDNYSIEEAPEEILSVDVDDQTLEKYSNADYIEQKNKENKKTKDDFIVENLKAINEPLLKAQALMGEPHNMKISDFTPKELIDILSKFKMINGLDEVSWNRAVGELNQQLGVNLTPATKPVVTKIHDYFINLVEKAHKAATENNGKYIGSKQLELLNNAKDILIDIHPDMSEKITNAISAVKNIHLNSNVNNQADNKQAVNATSSPLPNNNTDVTSPSNDVPPAPPIDSYVDNLPPSNDVPPAPPIDSYVDDLPPSNDVPPAPPIDSYVDDLPPSNDVPPAPPIDSHADDLPPTTDIGIQADGVNESNNVSNESENFKYTNEDFIEFINNFNDVYIHNSDKIDTKKVDLLKSRMKDKDFIANLSTVKYKDVGMGRDQFIDIKERVFELVQDPSFVDNMQSYKKDDSNELVLKNSMKK